MEIKFKQGMDENQEFLFPRNIPFLVFVGVSLHICLKAELLKFFCHLFGASPQNSNLGLCSCRDLNPGYGRERAVSLTARLQEHARKRVKSLLNLAIFI